MTNGKLFEHALRIVIIVVIVGAGFGIKKVLLGQKKDVSSDEHVDEVLSVRLAAVEHVNQQPVIRTSGNITAAQSVAVVPEVRGKVIWVKPDFASGVRLKKGTLIARIDARDIQAQLEQLNATKKAAELEIEIEKNRQDFAKTETKLLGELGTQTTALQKREPQLKAAQLRLQAAEAQIELANINLSRTEIRAPFDALVIDESIDLGQVVGGAPVATLIGAEAVHMRARLPVEVVRRLQSVDKASVEASVFYTSATDKIYQWPARFMLVEASLDPQLRSATARLEISKPFDHDAKPSLMPGSYADVEIRFGQKQDWHRIPKNALRGTGDKVWVIKDSRIEEVTVELGFVDSTYAYLDPSRQLDAVIAVAPKSAQKGTRVRDSGKTEAADDK